MKTLSAIRSSYILLNLIKIPSFARSIRTGAYPYHSIPPDDYHHPDENGNVYNSNFQYRNDAYLERRGFVDEFGRFRHIEPIHHWSDVPHFGYGYAHWGNELCPRCREAFYWGSDGYMPHWVNGYAGWNPRNGNMVGCSYNDQNLNPNIYPHYDGGPEFRGRDQPMQSNWISREYPQTWDVYHREGDGGPMPRSSRVHRNDYSQHWNNDVAWQNRESRDTYGLRGYKQGDMHQSNVAYKPSSVAENSILERPNVRFRGHETANSNRYIDKNAPCDPRQNLSSIPAKVDRVFQGNQPQNFNATRENDQQSSDRHERRYNDNMPQRHANEFRNKSYSENTNGSQKILTKHRSNFNFSSEGSGQHYEHHNNFRSGGVVDRPELTNSSTVNLDYKGGKRRDVKDHPQSYTTMEQPAMISDKMGKSYQSLSMFPQASNETATHSQQQQFQAKSSRDTQKQFSDWDFLGHEEPVSSSSLNTSRPDEGPECINNGSPTENLEPEQIRGTVEELEAFTKEGKLVLAVKVMELMERNKYHLDPERDLSKIKMLIQACGEAKAVEEAKSVHKHVVNLMSPLKFSVYNKILGMYLKCGAVSDACSMFYNMVAHNLTTWDTMIKGLVENSLAEESLDLFAEFKKTDSEPDGPMFLGVFSACRIVGDVIEGMMHFDSMAKQYGIAPSMKHYVSIVEIMGHVGHLDDAMEFIEKMPVKPSVDVWETMMNFCRIHGNTELGDRCAEVIHQLDPTRLSEESKAGLIPILVSSLQRG